LARHRERVFGRHDPELRTVVVDNANGANANLVVNAERSCYVRSLLWLAQTKNVAMPKHPTSDEPTGGSLEMTGSPEGIR
jgi:hypothetical protein